MIANGLRQTALAACVATAIGAMGCETEPRPVLGRRTARSALPQSSPEEAFGNIVITLRRALADQPGLLVSKEEGAFSKLQFHRQVEEELIPPKDKDGRYRGRIKVITRYSYRYRPPPEEEGTKSDKKGKSARDASDPLDFSNPSLDPLQAMDAELADSTNKPSLDNLIPRNLGSQTEDVETDDYELEYINDRWVLTTRLDPTEDKFILETFDFALKRQ